MVDYVILEISREELIPWVDVIREGFGTVADDLQLTVENCPTNGAFTTLERLTNDYDKGNLMYGLWLEGKPAGFTELEEKDNGLFYLEKITVLPQYRHEEWGAFLLDFSKSRIRELGGSRISIGIIEENTVLREWYLRHGFAHKGTKKFDHLPFTVGFMEYCY